MAYKYCTATNWGKNFFTHEERKQFHLSGHPGEVWVVAIIFMVINGSVK